MACCEVCNGDEKRENSIMKTLLYGNYSVSVYLLPTIHCETFAGNTNNGTLFVFVYSFNNYILLFQSVYCCLQYFIDINYI